MPKLSFVLSTCDRPGMLPVVLHALAVQTFADFEVIVTDNSEAETQAKNRRIIEGLNDPRFRHADTAALRLGNCYSTADWAVANQCTGDYVCFPSDDSYYVPRFAEIMMGAADRFAWDLIYCNMVYDPRFNGNHYMMVDVMPKVNCIDKTGFVVRRAWFDGFPGNGPDRNFTPDGDLIESLVGRGIRHGKVPDVLMVHN